MFTISPISKEQIDSLASQLSSVGDVAVTHNPQSNDYDIHGHGIVAKGMYENGGLSVTILHKPFYITEGMIESGIQSHIPKMEVKIPEPLKTT